MLLAFGWRRGHLTLASRYRMVLADVAGTVADDQVGASVADFQFGILGPLEVLVNGSTVTVSAGKQRVVLVSLLVAANRVVSAERLVELVWEDAPPAKPRNALQTYVMRLRRLLGGSSQGGPVFTGQAGYGIEVAADALDLDHFTDLVRRGRAALDGEDAVGGKDLLGQGLGLWRGEPLSDVPSETLRREVVPGLMEQWLGAVESRLEADLALGRHVEVLPELRELTAQHPLRERLWAQQMRALYQSGRQAEALECYRTVSELLVEELGVDPGQELRELYQQVLTADPVLTSPAVVRSVSVGASREGVRRLPAEITSFVGRETELAAGRRALQTERLVTLTGVGGVGKTRLAMRLAGQVEPEYPDGVCLADLAALTDPQQLGRTVAEAAGIYDQSMRPAA
ncbi:MAG: winged helix-turn-helix domain-containing protein, partial [Mycobacterium sp.]|nr:winged helix-turn-helix domain-containing protein [Mycobacterium sp.]